MVPKICSIPECERRHKARGYCSVHYTQWFRGATASERMGPSREDRFWSKVEKLGPDQCWVWNASLSDTGYGLFNTEDGNVRAHRYSFELHGQVVPEGLVLDHTCHNESDCTEVPCNHRRCVNPDHLEAVTQSINSIRGRSGDHQSAKTECPKGHPYSPENTIVGTSKNRRPRRTCRTCNRAYQAKYQAKRKAA